MIGYVSRLADRLLALVVPNGAAGACPCGDSWCTDWYGRCSSSSELTYCRSFCNCDYYCPSCC
jgi:hypothetical protein